MADDEDPLTPNELHLSRVVCAVGAMLGLAVIPVAVTMRLRTFRKRTDLSGDNVVLLFEKMILFKATLDGLLCLNLLGGLLVPGDSAGCKALGFMYQFEEIMTLVLIIRIAQHPFHFMLKKEDMTHTEQYFKRSVAACLVVATLVCVPLVAVSDFGRSGALCWMVSVPMQFYAFFSFVLAAWVIAVSICFRVARVTQHRYAGRVRTVYHGNFFARITEGMVWNMFNLVFGVVIYGYVFRLASRTFLWVNGYENAALSFLEMFTIAFRGPVDAMVYSPKDWLVRAFTWCGDCCLGRQRRESMDALSSMAQAAGAGVEPLQLTLLGKAYPLPFFTEPPIRTLEDRKIFVSTYNLAECKADALGPESLAAWIPQDMDIYVVGVQECMIYQQLGEAILAHVGGGEKYVLYRRAIGSTQQALGYHGLIALVVLARKEEIKANRFLLHESKTSAVARGKNLGVAVTENKGGVGLAFRYYDTTFAFLAAHLASDLKGRSRLHKRNQDAWRLTYETNLWREEYLLDVHHQHHVCVFLGDLNYRLRRSNAERVLEDLASICRQERDVACGGRRDWRKRRYAAILGAGRTGSNRDDATVVDSPGGESVAAPLHDGPLLEEEEEDYDEEDDDGKSGAPRPLQGLVPLLKSFLSEPSPADVAALTLQNLTSSRCKDESHYEVDEEDEEETARQEDLQLRALSRRDTIGARLMTSFQHIGRRESSRNLMQIKRIKDADKDLEKGRTAAPNQQQQQQQQQQQRGKKSAFSQQGVKGSSVAMTAAKKQAVDPEPSSDPSTPVVSRATTTTSQATSWDELLEYDELKIGMSKGDIFYGFQEGEIRFPPSYRRVKGSHGDCGDYTDADRLKKAFSIAVKEKPVMGALNRRLTKLPVARLLTSSRSTAQTPPTQPSPVSRPQSSQVQQPSPFSQRAPSPVPNGHEESTTNGGAAAGAGAAPAGADKTTTRIPSYTDRILLHVLEDHQERVTLGPYEMCDALWASDHRPVSTIVNAQVNVGVRGLNSFQQAKNFLQDPDVFGARDVATVHDACFYLLEFSNVRVDFLKTSLDESEHAEERRGLSNRAAGSKPDDDATVLVLFPLDNEDSFSTLRRPAVVAHVAKQIVFLTSKVERNPFDFFSLASYGAARKNGVTIVTCTRMDFSLGMHSIFSLRDDERGQLGACVIPLTDKAGKVIPERKGAVFPMTVGGCLCGHLFSDVKVTQLVLDGTTVEV